MNVFERKVYKRISGPLYDNEKDNWRILTNKEIYASVKKPAIIETIRLNRLRWFGHVERMEENRIPKEYYTGCPRRNGQNFGRMFFMLNYTDITQNTCIQSLTVTEIMAIEKCGLLGCPRTVSRP